MPTPQPVEAASHAYLLSAGGQAGGQLRLGETRAYRIKLRPGEVGHLTVEEETPNLVLTLCADGQQVLWDFSWLSIPKRHRLTLFGDQAREWTLILEASSLTFGWTRFRLGLESATSASAKDLRRRQAERLRAEAVAGLLQVVADQAEVAQLDLEAARRIFDELGEPLEMAHLSAYLGVVQFMLGDYEGALRFQDEALAMFESCGDRWGHGILRSFRATTLGRLGRVAESTHELHGAVAVLDEVGDLRFLPRVLGHLGLRAQARGDWQGAWDAYHRGLAISRNAGYLQGVATGWYRLARLSFDLGELEMAREYAELAVAAAGTLGFAWTRSEYLHLLGQIYVALGDEPRADDAWRRAESDAAEAGNLGMHGRILATLGQRRTREGAWDAAAEKLATARSLALSPQSAAEVDLLQCDLDLARGQLVRAREGYLGVLTQAIELMAESLRSAALEGLARTAQASGDLAAAVDFGEAALRRIEAQRGSVPRSDLLLAYQASRAGRFEWMIDLEMQGARVSTTSEGRLQAMKRALDISERARARTLLDALMGPASAVGVRDSELEAKQQALLAELDGLQLGTSHDLSEGQSRAELDRKLEELRQLERALAPVQQSVGSQSLAASARQSAPQVPAPGEVILEYALGSERSYLWVIERDRELVAHELPPRVKIEGHARKLHSLLANSYAAGAASQAGIEAQHLRRMILDPVRDRIHGKRVMVVADGALHYVPFAYLIQFDFGKAGMQGSTVRVPSISVLESLRARRAHRQRSGRAIAIFADPLLIPQQPENSAVEGEGEGPRHQTRLKGQPSLGSQHAMEVFERTRRTSGVRDFPPLRFARREAQAIRAIAPDAVDLMVLGAEANREFVLAADLASYEVLHFATHGVLNERHPELSGLVLASADRKAQGRPTLLRPPEISRLRLQAELVVLSACQTALGREVRGEGLVGMTQAFLHAGADRVLVSLWNVNDEATAVLMESFYDGLLRQKLDVATALLRAQQWVASDPRWQRPYFWAGFVLIGEG